MADVPVYFRKIKIFVFFYDMGVYYITKDGSSSQTPGVSRMGVSLDNLATNVKSFREKKGLTQIQLAAKANLNINTIFRLEQKRGNPSWATVHMIAEALGIDAQDLTKAK